MNTRAEAGSARRAPWKFLVSLALVTLIAGAVGFAGSLGSGGGAVTADRASTAGPSVDPTDTAQVRAVFEASTDAYFAVDAPAPPAGQRADTNGLPPLSDDRDAPPVAHLNDTGTKAYLSPAEQDAMRGTAASALSKLFTPELAAQYLNGKVANAIKAESDGPRVVAAGGATVENYLAVDVRDAAATVKAVVTGWERVGYVDAESGEVSWKLISSAEVVTDMLVRDASGAWLVSDYEWAFEDGSGP